MSKTRLEEAQERVLQALNERKRFGKHYSNSDLPREFLDDLLLVQEADAAQRTEYVPLADYEALKAQLTKSNRQLAAAKAREAKMREI